MQRHKYGLTIKASLSRQLARLCDADHYSLYVRFLFQRFYKAIPAQREFGFVGSRRVLQSVTGKYLASFVPGGFV